MIVLTFLVNLGMLLIPAAPFAWIAWRLSKKSSDEWQLLVWVPVLPLAIWGVLVAVAVTRDRTSHNLWPFEAAIWGALSALLLGLVVVARRFAVRAAASRQPSSVFRRPPTGP